MQARQVRALLMGGQACVLYGAAQFSRDVDLAILAEAGNLERLAGALRDLQAEIIAVPPFAARHLERGHAIHFRCRHPEARDIRVDVLAKLRGVAPFPRLWERRTSLVDETGCAWELLALGDLVKAKKTQRDKDWPMVRALVEAHYFANRGNPSPAAVEFWLGELRTPELLAAVAREHRASAEALIPSRPLLQAALAADVSALRHQLTAEEQREREADAAYWAPLKAELEELRRERLRG